MGRYTPLYSNWSSGELSSRLSGRADIKDYYSGASELTNVLVWAHGGITKRPGTAYKATAIDSTRAVRLIPFEYSTTQAYIIELGNYTARFYMNGGLIYSGASPYQIATPWPATGLSDIRFVQSADLMYLVHPDYAPRKLVRNGDASWALTTETFENGPFLETNSSAVTITPSALTGSVTLVASSAIFDSLHVGSLWKIAGDIKVTENFTAINQFSDAIEVDAGEAITVQLNGTWVATVYLQRSIDGGSTWLDYKSLTFNTSLSYDETADNTLYRLGIRNVAGEYVAGTVNAALIKHNQFGTVRIVVYNSTTNVTANVEKTLPATTATTEWAEAAWSDLNGWPETVAFFEQRLIFGGNWYKPQTVWASKVGDYTDFDEGESADDDAYTFTLASSDVNSIKWMVDADTLRIGTHGGEWRFGLRDSPTTPTNVDVKRYSSQGSAGIQGALIGSSVLFIQRGGIKLRAMTYDLQQEAYISPDVTMKAEHMLKQTGGVVDMAFADQPDPTIWMVTASGTLVACTYDQSNGISAFHEHETDGEFESVAIIPGSDRDEVWFVVKRNIDGTDLRYVEQMQTAEWTNQEAAIYMDSTITYEGAATTSITGLDHLEGKSLAIITNGATHPAKSVSGGEIELEWSSTKVLLGLNYTSNAVTMPIAPPTEAGTAVGKRKKGFKLIVNFYQTNYCKIGAYGDTLDEIPFRTSGDLMDNKVPLYTETREAAFPHGYKRDLKIHIQSDRPLPFSIVGLAPVMITSAV